MLFHTSKYRESGFVFAPFDAVQKTVLIPMQASNFVSELADDTIEHHEKSGYRTIQSAKGSYINLVKKTIEDIKKSTIKKIVVSRKEVLRIENWNCINTFLKLLATYKGAMVYMWYHPKIGMWMGATPETLLQVKNSSFLTMSLAGTQVFNANTLSWGAKELEEQQLVTTFIQDQLTPIVKDIKIQERESIRAGNVLHLRTLISGKFDVQKASLQTLLKRLHPTPAVCGLPREVAKMFILTKEGYDRKFYTGFLGEMNLENTSSFFVNLRCMEIEEKTANLYVGGGITLHSSPEKEWEETQLKITTLKNVL
ncbi:MAG: isochorismate synthase [Flavobacteriaceae bacterium]|nr:MAG: isochorismate synthase [Flavobacteriaceae bacterium]